MTHSLPLTSAQDAVLWQSTSLAHSGPGVWSWTSMRKNRSIQTQLSVSLANEKRRGGTAISYRLTRASPRCLSQSQNSQTAHFLGAENNDKSLKSQALPVVGPLQSLSVQGDQFSPLRLLKEPVIFWSKETWQNRYMVISIFINKISTWDEKNHRTMQIPYSIFGLQRKKPSSLYKADLDPNCQVKSLIKQYLRRVIRKTHTSLQTAPHDILG